LESTNVSGKRLIAAILMIALAYTVPQCKVRKLNGWVCRNMSVVSKNMDEPKAA